MALIKNFNAAGGASEINLVDTRITYTSATIADEPLVFEIDNFQGSATIKGDSGSNYVGVRVYVNDVLVGSTTHSNPTITVTSGKISIHAYKISNFQTTDLTFGISST